MSADSSSKKLGMQLVEIYDHYSFDIISLKQSGELYDIEIGSVLTKQSMCNGYSYIWHGCWYNYN